MKALRRLCVYGLRIMILKVSLLLRLRKSFKNHYFLFFFMKNTFLAKFLRQFSAFFPKDNSRTGQCKRCGKCCMLPYRCPFLKFDNEGLAHCMIYYIRPLSCRIYPRNKNESLIKDCGFKFEVKK